MQKQMTKSSPTPNPPVQQASVPRLIAEIFVRIFERRPSEEKSTAMVLVELVFYSVANIFLVYIIYLMVTRVFL